MNEASRVPLRALASLAAALVLCAGPAGAQSDAPSPPPVAIVPALVVPPPRRAAPVRAPRAAYPPPTGGAWSPQPSRALALWGGPGNGVTLGTGDGFFALTLRARAQVRDTLVVPRGVATPAVTNELNVRTLRLILAGHAFSRSAQYVLQLALAPQDFEPGSASPLFDAWIALEHLRDLRVRVGQFFVPFDRARTNAEWGLNLVDRPLLVGEATLDRDVGIELSSNDLGGLGVLGYRLGVFGGEGRNRLATSPGFLYVARVQFTPFGAFDDGVEGDLARLARPRLALGLAAAFNHNAQRQRSTHGATLALGAFDYTHLAADAVFKYAGLYLLGEVVYRQASADRHDGTANGMAAAEFSRSVWGYLVQAGMMLTARLEVAGRWEQMFAVGATDPGLITQIHAQGNEFGVGVNWYQAGHGLKVQGDYAYLFGERFTQGRHQFRLQVQFAF